MWRGVAGPRLGDGPRWDVHRAVAATEQAKLELGILEELSSKWRCAGELLRYIRGVVDEVVWDQIRGHSDSLEGFELDDVEDPKNWDHDLEGVKTDVERLETENGRLRRRCGALLEQALSGSEHGDVAFRFEDGRSPFTGHRAVLCAASEEYAGMFRSGMVEGQEGIFGVPPGVSEAGYRGLLEWAYLGESPSLSCLIVFVLLILGSWEGGREGGWAHLASG